MKLFLLRWAEYESNCVNIEMPITQTTVRRAPPVWKKLKFELLHCSQCDSLDCNDVHFKWTDFERKTFNIRILWSENLQMTFSDVQTCVPDILAVP